MTYSRPPEVRDLGPCIGCGHPMRSPRTPPAALPGTRQRGGFGKCGRCRARSLSVARIERVRGMAPGEWHRMLIAQAGRCAVCGEPMQDPHIDHNHESGRVREMLCANCNTAEGLLGGNPERARNLADYLDRHARIDAAA